MFDCPCRHLPELQVLSTLAVVLRNPCHTAVKQVLVPAAVLARGRRGWFKAILGGGSDTTSSLLARGGSF